MLAADFPEICDPIRALEGSTQRQKTQTVDGELTRLHWSGQWVRFPPVKKSPASGAIIATKGLDAHIRGIKVGPRRPKLIIIDDPETEESAKSPDQVDNFVIDRASGGSGGPSRAVSVGMLGTIQNQQCLMNEYCDPVRRPNWHGVKFKWLEKMPDNMELWEKYMHQRTKDQQKDSNDPYCRTSHGLYLANRPAMDQGAGSIESISIRRSLCQTVRRKKSLASKHFSITLPMKDGISSTPNFRIARPTMGHRLAESRLN